MMTKSRFLLITLSLLSSCLHAEVNVSRYPSNEPIKSENRNKQYETTPDNKVKAMGSHIDDDINGNVTCRASTRDYAAPYRELYKKKIPLLEDCALGKLVNFATLKKFDPFGSILDAINGAICKAVQDITDPYVKTVNKEIRGANKWVKDKEAGVHNGYDSWVNQTQRDTNKGVYDSVRFFDKKDKPSNNGGNNKPPTYAPPTPTPAPTPSPSPTPPQNDGSQDNNDGTITIGEGNDAVDVILDDYDPNESLGDDIFNILD